MLSSFLHLQIRFLIGSNSHPVLNEGQVWSFPDIRFSSKTGLFGPLRNLCPYAASPPLGKLVDPNRNQESHANHDALPEDRNPGNDERILDLRHEQHAQETTDDRPHASE